jgi:hypothetical protein
MNRILMAITLLTVVALSCGVSMSTPTPTAVSVFDLSFQARRIIQVLNTYGFLEDNSVLETISYDGCLGGVTCDGYSGGAQPSSAAVYYSGEAVYYFPLDPDRDKTFLQMLTDIYGDNLSDWVRNHLFDATDEYQEGTTSGFDLKIRFVDIDSGWIYLIVSPH